jgi:hypothetical protein
MFLLTLVYLLINNDIYPIREVIQVSVGFIVLIAISTMLTLYGDEDNSYIKLNKYFATIGMFSLATALIMYFESPSFIPLLFVAYCMCAIYQDMKVMIISNIYFIVSILLTVISYPDLLKAETATLGTNFSIGFFSLLFLIMLSVSAYIIMKEKSFFYNQISNSKEIEYRNIDLLIKLKHDTDKHDKNFMSYYERTNDFLEAFSKKIELPNVFEEKINIIKKLEEKVSYKDILKQYPEYTEKDLDRLSKLLMSEHNTLGRVAVKISKTNEEDIQKREIFSGTHFKSFNKSSDTTETKIIAFVIFYVALKKGLYGMEKLNGKDIYEAITNSDYFHYIDSRVMKIYMDNSDVFDDIISDAFSKGGKKR